MKSVRVISANRSGRIGGALMGLVLVVLAAAPAWGGRDDLRLLSEIYAYVGLASLWNLLAGYAGLVSVGQQAYVGLGAYLLFALTLLLGGILLGVAQAIGAEIDPGWQTLAGHLMFLFVLAVRPEGLFPKERG